MPVNPNLPDTIDVANALLAYLQAAQFNGTSNNIYVQSSSLSSDLQVKYPTGGVRIGRFKDPSDLLPPGSSNIIAEIHADDDISKRYTTGGRTNDYTDFPVVSMTNEDDSTAAWLRMFSTRDSIIPYIIAHSQLGGAGNALIVKLIPGGKYVEVFRGKWYLGYIMKVQVESQWVSQGGFTS